MESNIYALLKKAWAVSKSQGANVYGVEIGIVTNVKDPDQQGRVKVCFPRLQGNPESDWARVSQPAAGDGRGFYWLPHVNDEVLVAFERGQANCPYVIGSLWNGKDKPMKDAYTDENTTVMVQTRSGHQIALHDKSGEEKIVIGDKSGKRTLTFDVKAKKFLVEAKEGDLELHAKKKIVIDCEDIEIKTSKTGKADIGTTFDLKVTQKAQLAAGPQMNLKASKVQLNPSELTIEALVAAAIGAAAGAAAAAATGGNVAQGAAAGAAAGYSAATGGTGIVPSTDVLEQAVTGGAEAGAEAGEEGAGKAGSGGVEGTEWTKVKERPAAKATETPAATEKPPEAAPAETTTQEPAAAAPAATTTQEPTVTTTLQAASSPQPGLSTDAQSPQPVDKAFNLNWTIQNWADGMTASISCDQDIGDDKGTDPQDVTSAVQSDGSGSLAINPPSGGALNAGTFNYTLTVTPQTRDPVSASPVAVTVGAAAQAASATLQIAAGDGAADAQASTDYEAPVTLTWKVTGASGAQLSVAQVEARTSFDGTTAEGGEVRLAVNLGSALPSRVTMYDGGTPIETWEFHLDPPDEPSGAPADLSGDSPKVAFASLLGGPVALPIDDAGNGQGTIIVDPGPHSSVTFALTVSAKDGSAEITANATAQVTNFFAALQMADGSPAPANKKITLELGVSAGETTPATGDGTETV